MRTVKRGSRVSWLLAMVFLMAMAGFAQDFPLSADLAVAKYAPAEVGAGSAFSYIITVENLDASNNASDVVVTDKLPFEVNEVVATDITAPEASSISVTGDLVTVTYDEIPANNTIFTILINVTAPSDAPTTLYNTVIVRYADDPDTSNNTATTATYVLEAGYGKVAAIESFEDLLHRQSALLFSFQELLNQIPDGAEENYTFITSCEQLLRAQANLTSCFEGLLLNETGSGWDNDFTSANRTDLLRSYETMLREEAYLFAGFNAKIENSWVSLDNFTADGHTLDAQTEFIASFEDLLKRQTRLYHGFELLFKRIDRNAEPQTHENLVAFLASFEDLLRVESNLLMGFQELLEEKFKEEQPVTPEIRLSLAVQSAWDLTQDFKTYNFTVNNTGTADALGVVLTSKYDLFLADNASLNTTPPEFIAALNSPQWVDNLNGTVSYTFADVPAGGSASAALVIHVPGIIGNGTLVNTACLYPPGICVQDLNNRTMLTMPAPPIKTNLGKTNIGKANLGKPGPKKTTQPKVRDVLMRM